MLWGTTKGGSVAQTASEVVRTLDEYEYEGGVSKELAAFALDLVREENASQAALYGKDFVARVGHVVMRSDQGKYPGDRATLYVERYSSEAAAKHEYRVIISFYDSGGI